MTLGVQSILLVPLGITIQKKNDLSCLDWTCPICAYKNISVNTFSQTIQETHQLFKCKNCGSAVLVKTIKELVKIHKLPPS